MLTNSHLMTIQALDNLAEEDWDLPNACGSWSIKEIVAHLASYELTLLDVLNTFRGQEPTAAIGTLLQNGAEFNAQEVEKRRYDTAQHILGEYNDVQIQTESLLAQIPAAQVLQGGSMPWYDKERSLGDLIAQMCKHSANHIAQVKTFRASHHV
jgi:uncharacterized damage-inducible protein DinB